MKAYVKCVLRAVGSFFMVVLGGGGGDGEAE